MEIRKFEKNACRLCYFEDGITVNPERQTGISPLFVMEKMQARFSKASGDWRYTMIAPNGKGNATVTF